MEYDDRYVGSLCNLRSRRVVEHGVCWDAHRHGLPLIVQSAHMTDEGGKRESLASISQPGARAKTRWMEDCAGERRPGCSGKKLLAACQEAAGDRKRQILEIGRASCRERVCQYV